VATIVHRGAHQWQARVRRKCYPPVSKTFGTKAEAKRWARLVESEMDHGAYVSREEAESLHNPVSNVRKPRLPPGRDCRLAGDEEQRLLEHAEYPMQELIVPALETGMRQGELLTFRRSDEAAAAAHRQWNPDRFVGGHGERSVVTGKGGFRREVQVPRDLTARLEARLIGPGVQNQVRAGAARRRQSAAPTPLAPPVLTTTRAGVTATEKLQ
jgi:integrase